MLDAERQTVSLVRRNPVLLAGGVLQVAALAVAYAVGWHLASGMVLPTWMVVLLAIGIGSVVRVILVPFPLAGLYAASHRARSDGAGSGGGLSAVVSGAVRHYRRLLGATVRYRLFVLALAVPLFGLVLAGDTALTAVRYAMGGDQLAILMENRRTVIVMVLLAGALARFPAVFYDLPVLFGGVAGSRGWRFGLRFTRRRPMALLRYGVGRVLLWSPAVVGPVAAAVALERMETAPAGLVPGVIAVLGVIWLAIAAIVLAVTLVAAYHVVVYERTVESVLSEPTATGTYEGSEPPSLVTAAASDEEKGAVGRRGIAVVALVALLVTSAAVGATTVRIGDVRPMPDDQVRPVEPSMDAETVVENARLATARTSHRGVYRRNRVDHLTGERTRMVANTYYLDREERQYLSMRPDGTTFYGSTGTFAGDYEGFLINSPIDLRRMGSERNGWLVASSPGYVHFVQFVFEEMSFVVPYGGDWRIVNRTDERIVVGFDAGEEPGGSPNGSYSHRQVRVYVDVDTGRPTKTVDRQTFRTFEENGTVVSHEEEVTIVEFSDYGTTDVERPRSIGEKGLLEWLSDLVFY